MSFCGCADSLLMVHCLFCFSDVPRHCAHLKTTKPGARSKLYDIDPDGLGPSQLFQVKVTAALLGHNALR